MKDMIRFERTHDLNLVQQIITEPSIWRQAGDDGVGKPEDFRASNHPSIWYVLAFDGDEALGMFAFYAENAITYDVHTCLLPTALRPHGRSLAAARACRQWIWENTPCRRITTHVPAYNRLALLFAQKAGLIEFGVNPMSLLKNGQLHDQILLGISRPEDM